MAIIRQAVRLQLRRRIHRSVTGSVNLVTNEEMLDFLRAVCKHPDTAQCRNVIHRGHDVAAVLTGNAQMMNTTVVGQVERSVGRTDINRC